MCYEDGVCCESACVYVVTVYMHSPHDAHDNREPEEREDGGDGGDCSSS